LEANAYEKRAEAILLENAGHNGPLNLENNDHDQLLGIQMGLESTENVLHDLAHGGGV
jgi:hypothetical protein